MLYQGYRDWNSIPLTWGALVDFHGEPTARFHAAADVCRVVKQQEDFFLDALPPRAEIALYHTHENVIALDGQANEKFLYKALRGAHRALWEAGYSLQFVEPRFLGTPTAYYKVILLPFLMHLPQAHADKLTEFVAQGGTLIGCAKLGHLDEQGWAWNDRPGAGLTSLFGAKETHLEVFREPHPKITLKVEPSKRLFNKIDAEVINGYWHRQEFALGDDVEVLAQFVDDTPAIIRRRYGQGQAILAATHFDMALWEYHDPALRQLFDNLMALCGVGKDIYVTGSDPEYVKQRIDGHLLSHRSHHAVLVNNEGECPVNVTLAVPVASSATSAVELFSGQSLELSSGQFSLHLPAEDGAIVMLR
jgi:beta-galactosidase